MDALRWIHVFCPFWRTWYTKHDVGLSAGNSEPPHCSCVLGRRGGASILASSYICAPSNTAKQRFTMPSLSMACFSFLQKPPNSGDLNSSITACVYDRVHPREYYPPSIVSTAINRGRIKHKLLSMLVHRSKQEPSWYSRARLFYHLVKHRICPQRHAPVEVVKTESHLEHVP